MPAASPTACPHRPDGLTGRGGAGGPLRARAGWVAALAAALTVAGCGGPSASPPVVTLGSSVAGAPAAGTLVNKALDPAVLALPLKDEHGRVVSLGSLAGKTVVLTDFLTTCQEVCPMTSVDFRTAAKAVAAAGLSGSVEFLEVTVDPERDDPERLAAYQQLYGQVPGWDFATAGTAGTAALWKALGVSYSKVANTPPLPRDWLTGGPLGYDITHQDVVFVIDPSGHERWLTSGSPSTAGQQPPTTLLHFLNDEGRSNLAAPPDPSWTAADLTAAVALVTGHAIG